MSGKNIMDKEEKILTINDFIWENYDGDEPISNNMKKLIKEYSEYFAEKQVEKALKIASEKANLIVYEPINDLFITNEYSYSIEHYQYLKTVNKDSILNVYKNEQNTIK